jgi:hypothetical protein
MNPSASSREDVESHRGARALRPTIQALEYVEKMPFVTLDSLPAVVRALAPSGIIVALGYEETQQQLTFYRLEEWMLCVQWDEGKLSEQSAVSRREPSGVGSDAHVVPHTSEDNGMEPGRQSPRYDKETSDRIARGSVMLSRDTLWAAELAVSTTGDQSALLIIERHGPGREIGSQDAAIAIPPGEVDAVQTLLTGIIAQARRDGVLSDNSNLQAAVAEEIEPRDT